VSALPPAAPRKRRKTEEASSARKRTRESAAARYQSARQEKGPVFPFYSNYRAQERNGSILRELLEFFSQKKKRDSRRRESLPPLNRIDNILKQQFYI